MEFLCAILGGYDKGFYGNQIGKLNQKIIDEADNVEQTENVSE